MNQNNLSWTRLLIEGAVIVGSILLAFSLDAWWDGRNRDEELLGQLEVVSAEMQSTREALELAVDSHERSASHAARLSEILQRVVDGTEVTIPDTLVGPLLPQFTADVGTGSLDAFVTAGGLELIDDAEVRGQLREWPTRIEDLRDDETYLRNFPAAELAAYLRANADIANAELYSIPWLMEKNGLGPPVDPGLLGTSRLRRDRRLLNLLAARESHERGMRFALVVILEQAVRLAAALEAID